jgi:hypothetical protein
MKDDVEGEELELDSPIESMEHSAIMGFDQRKEMCELESVSTTLFFSKNEIRVVE